MDEDGCRGRSKNRIVLLDIALEEALFLEVLSILHC